MNNNVRLSDFAGNYAIGACLTQIEDTDKGRVSAVDKGLGDCNQPYEISIASTWEAVQSIRKGLTGNWARLDADIEEQRLGVLARVETHPWNTSYHLNDFKKE